VLIDFAWDRMDRAFAQYLALPLWGQAATDDERLGGEGAWPQPAADASAPV